MRLSTLRTAASCILLLALRLGASQGVELTLSPMEARAGKTLRLRLLLNAPSNSAPAGLQWTFGLPPGLDIVRIEAGKAVKKAGKTLVCNGAKCLVYGLRTTKVEIQVADVAAVSLDAKAIRRWTHVATANPLKPF